MRLTLLTALMSLSACAPAEPHCSTRFASSRTFVIDELVLPRALVSYAADLNGDGNVDNRLAKLIDTFLGQALDLQQVVDRDIHEKRFAPKLILHASSTSFDPAAVVGVTLGEESQRTLCVDADAEGLHSDDAEQKVATPVSLTWPFFMGHSTEMVGASVAFRVDGDRLLDGRFRAAITQREVALAIYPGMADLLNYQLFDDPQKPGTSPFLFADTGGMPSPGCTPQGCRNPDGSCGMKQNLHFEECEISTNSNLASLFAPDVQLFKDERFAPQKDNAVKDSWSLGVAFSAHEAP
jgi:hypothetical protein